MSLTREEQEMTREDLRRAMDALGITPEEAAVDLETTPAYVRRVLRLDIRRLEDPWILRGYLLRKAAEQGVDVEFRVLRGDYHSLWFLDAGIIDRGLLGA